MTDAPKTILLTPNGGLPTGHGWKRTDLIEYHHDDTVTQLKARIAELEADVEALIKLWKEATYVFTAE